MPSWIHDPQSSYVLAAYAVAAVGLIGLLASSIASAAKRKAEWEKIKLDNPRDNQR